MSSSRFATLTRDSATMMLSLLSPAAYSLRKAQAFIVLEDTEDNSRGS
jgi:hypothetical protein